MALELRNIARRLDRMRNRLHGAINNARWEEMLKNSNKEEEKMRL